MVKFCSQKWNTIKQWERTNGLCGWISQSSVNDTNIIMLKLVLFYATLLLYPLKVKCPSVKLLNKNFSYKIIRKHWSFMWVVSIDFRFAFSLAMYVFAFVPLVLFDLGRVGSTLFHLNLSLTEHCVWCSLTIHNLLLDSMC